VINLDRCRFCGGLLKESTAMVKTHWRDRTITLNNVNSWICDSCGEVYLNHDMAKNIKALERPMDREEFLMKPYLYRNEFKDLDFKTNIRGKSEDYSGA